MCWCCCSRAYDKSENHRKSCTMRWLKATHSMAPGKLRDRKGPGSQELLQGHFPSDPPSFDQALYPKVPPPHLAAPQTGSQAFNTWSRGAIPYSSYHTNQRSDSLSPHRLLFSLVQQMRVPFTSSGKTLNVLCLPPISGPSAWQAVVCFCLLPPYRNLTAHVTFQKVNQFSPDHLSSLSLLIYGRKTPQFTSLSTQETLAIFIMYAEQIQGPSKDAQDPA